jgi:hypothetical protein
MGAYSLFPQAMVLYLKKTIQVALYVLDRHLGTYKMVFLDTGMPILLILFNLPCFDYPIQSNRIEAPSLSSMCVKQQE